MGLDSFIQERVGGLDTERDWSTVLSLGQQQLLAITRLIFARPAFALLDRVTESLNQRNYERYCGVWIENSITYIAFAEEAESIELYDAVLEIDSDGGWTWNRTSRTATAAAT